jgi:hypothetical protein
MLFYPAVVSAMNSVYRRNRLPIQAFIHCMAESRIHDYHIASDYRMDVFASSNSLGRNELNNI